MRNNLEQVHEVQYGITISCCFFKVVEIIAKITAQIPVGRLGTPDEIARCVLFLVSDDAAFITGSTLSANGGQFFV